MNDKQAKHIAYINRKRNIKVTLKPWKSQMFECKKIASEPSLNTEGFWVKQEFMKELREKPEEE